MEPEGVILLAEDSEEDIWLFREVLERSGLGNRLQVVENGAEAISYLTGEERFSDRTKFSLPGAFLLDLNLPKLSGWEVLRWVRSRLQFRDLLVVVFTGSVEVGHLRRAYAMGADSFLFKPWAVEDLTNLAKAFSYRWPRVGASGSATRV